MSHLGGTDSVPKLRDRLRYTRTPLTVLRDARLSLLARVVYGELAANVFQGSVANIGLRLVAERIGASKSSVARAVRELETAGHLVPTGEEKRRTYYTLTSPVFGQKQGRMTEVVSSPSGGKRYASIAKEEVA